VILNKKFLSSVLRQHGIWSLLLSETHMGIWKDECCGEYLDLWWTK